MKSKWCLFSHVLPVLCHSEHFALKISFNSKNNLNFTVKLKQIRKKELKSEIKNNKCKRGSLESLSVCEVHGMSRIDIRLWS